MTADDEPTESAEPTGATERRGLRQLWGLLYRSVRRQAQDVDHLTARVDRQEEQIHALTERTEFLRTKIEMLERR